MYLASVNPPVNKVGQRHMAWPPTRSGQGLLSLQEGRDSSPRDFAHSSPANHHLKVCVRFPPMTGLELRGRVRLLG